MCSFLKDLSIFSDQSYVFNSVSLPIVVCSTVFITASSLSIPIIIIVIFYCIISTKECVLSASNKTTRTQSRCVPLIPYSSDLWHTAVCALFISQYLAIMYPANVFTKWVYLVRTLIFTPYLFAIVFLVTNNMHTKLIIIKLCLLSSVMNNKTCNFVKWYIWKTHARLSGSKFLVLILSVWPLIVTQANWFCSWCSCVL